jgi:hypothetical protein
MQHDTEKLGDAGSVIKGPAFECIQAITYKISSGKSLVLCLPVDLFADLAQTAKLSKDRMLKRSARRSDVLHCRIFKD